MNTRMEKETGTGQATWLHRLTQSYGMILAGLGMAFLYWLLEALIHSTLSGKGSLRAGMAPQNPNDLWTRLFVVFCFLFLGVSAQWLLARRRHDQESLRLQAHALGERVKELDCLYSISRLIEHSGTSLARVLQGAVDLIPTSWQYPEITCARIVVGEGQYTTRKFRETEWRQTAPIHVLGRPVGTVEVYYLEERPASDEGPFAKEERALIAGISELLGRMIERSKAREALQEARQKIERLHETARQLEVLDDEDTVYRTTVEAAETILSFSMCALDVVVGDTLVTKASSSQLPPGASHERNLASGGLAVETWRTGKTTVFGSLTEVPQAIPSRADLRSGISAPIGTGIGVFQVASTEENAFVDEDVHLLELLLGHAAEAIHRIRLAERLREQALRDPVTGVYNRRYFNQVIG
jgi:GAF domain-containing protein